jgi:hypothetical protein
MSLKVWEVTLAIPLILLAALFALGGYGFSSIAITVAVALWLITRIKVSEDHEKGGRYGRRQAWLGAAKVSVVFVAYLAGMSATWVVRGKGDERIGQIAIYALAGLLFLLYRELDRAGNDVFLRLKGARAEERVDSELRPLLDKGWLVTHNFLKDWGGDIDHVVCNTTGAFAIETKSGPFRKRDLNQTLGNAAWLHDRLGVRWVTGVLCVGEKREAEKFGSAWVMGPSALRPWIESRRETGIEPAEARRLLGLE